jgi:hypothetical protein
VEGTADVDLPSNKATATVAKGGNTSITIPAIGPETDGKTNGVFQVTGLTAGATTTNALTTVTGTVDASSTVPASGIVNLPYTINQNNTVNNIVGTLTVTEGTASTLNITQLAHPLGLSVSEIGSDGKSITLASTATGITNEDWNTAAIAVTRNKGGVTTNLTKGTKAPGIFALNAGDKNIIELDDADEMELGDVYTVTVTAGDAPTETYTFTIGGIAFVPATRSIEYGTTGFKPAPVYYGGEPSGYTGVSSSEVATATVASTTDATITTVGVNGNTTTDIQMTATQPAVDGYYYTTNSRTAKYTLTVTKAEGTISFTDPTPANPAAFTTGNYDAGDVILTNLAVLKNSKGTTLTTGSIGTVSYSVSDDDNFQIGSDGILKFKGTWAAGDSHQVTVTATVTDGYDATYATKTATYIITVTAAS